MEIIRATLSRSQVGHMIKQTSSSLIIVLEMGPHTLDLSTTQYNMFSNCMEIIRAIVSFSLSYYMLLQCVSWCVIKCAFLVHDPCLCNNIDDSLIQVCIVKKLLDYNLLQHKTIHFNLKKWRCHDNWNASYTNI